MKKLILLMIVLVTVSVVSAQTPSDFPYQHIIENVDFENLSISGQIDVFISQADVNTVEIRYLEPDRMQYVTVEQKNRTLSIITQGYAVGYYFIFVKKEWGKKFDSRIQVHVGMADIKHFNFGNNLNISYQSDIKLGSITQQVGYKGNLNTDNLLANEFNLYVGNNGTVSMGNLTLKNVKITTNYKSRLDIKSISAETLNLNIGSNSIVKIDTLDTIKMTIRTGYQSQLVLENTLTPTLSTGEGEK